MMTQQQVKDLRETVDSIRELLKRLFTLYGTKYICVLSTDLNDEKRSSDISYNGSGADIVVMFKDLIEDENDIKSLMSAAITMTTAEESSKKKDKATDIKRKNN